MNFRYFYNKNNSHYYRVEVNKKYNITLQSKAWVMSTYEGYSASDWRIIDVCDPENIWRNYGSLEKLTIDKINYIRYIAAIKIVKNQDGRYVELSYEDFVLEMI